MQAPRRLRAAERREPIRSTPRRCLQSEAATALLITAMTPPTISVASPATHTTSPTTPVGSRRRRDRRREPRQSNRDHDGHGVQERQWRAERPSFRDGREFDQRHVWGVFCHRHGAARLPTALDALVFTPAKTATTTFTISDVSSAYPLAVSNSATSVSAVACYCQGHADLDGARRGCGRGSRRRRHRGDRQRRLAPDCLARSPRP